MPRQRRDLAGVIHADLDHGKARCGRHARQRQRHTPVVVEGLLRRVHAAGLRQAGAQHLLGARLAGAAGDRDDARLALKPRTRGPADALQRAQRIVDADQRAIARRARIASRARGSRRAARERGRHEVVPVALGLQRHEHLAGRQRARVDGEAGHRTAAAPSAVAARSRDQIVPAPERWHQPFPPSPPIASTDRLLVRERQHGVAHDLAGLMALCRPPAAHHPTPSMRTAAVMASARSPISRAPGAAARISARIAVGPLAARIVVGDDHHVGFLNGDAAHDRPLARVAIAAAAEHADQAARSRRDAAHRAPRPAPRACARSR